MHKPGFAHGHFIRKILQTMIPVDQPVTSSTDFFCRQIAVFYRALTIVGMAAVITCSIPVHAATETALLPQPQHIVGEIGSFNLCDEKILYEAGAQDENTQRRLATAIESFCNAAGNLTVRKEGTRQVVFHNNTSGGSLPGTNDSPGAKGREAYTLRIANDQIEIRASSSAGIAYGTETLLQLIHALGPGVIALNAIQIEDWPSLPYRGLMIDTAHGAKPTIEFLKELLDQMASWKMNQLYLYVETNLPLTNPTPPWHANMWSKSEIGDLVSYAAVRHIDVVPCVELYGHLHELLTNESESPIGAFPHGGELNPAETRTAEIVKSWTRQIANMFPSSWLHIGFDEPFELDRMNPQARRNIAPDKLWSDHLHATAELVLSLGKKPMFWADIDEGAFLFNKYPQLASSLPKAAVAVPWFYDARSDYSPLLSLFKQFDVPLMVAPAISDWDDIFPDYATSFQNIQGMITAGRAVNAKGMVNTIWSDSAMALHSVDAPGIAYSAAASWESSTVPSRDFFRRFSGINRTREESTAVAIVYEELSSAETLYKDSFGAEPVFRSFDMPFSATYLQTARVHSAELIKVRLHTEAALDHLQSLASSGYTGNDLAALIADARWLDYAALRGLYVVEIADNFEALPAIPTADDLQFRLGRETASRNHSRVDDLIDRAGECLEAYRAAWLSESTRYRLSSAEMRFMREQQFWIDFQAHIWRIRHEFKADDPRPTLDTVLKMHP